MEKKIYMCGVPVICGINEEKNYLYVKHRYFSYMGDLCAECDRLKEADPQNAKRYEQELLEKVIKMDPKAKEKDLDGYKLVTIPKKDDPTKTETLVMFETELMSFKYLPGLWRENRHRWNLLPDEFKAYSTGHPEMTKENLKKVYESTGILTELADEDIQMSNDMIYYNHLPAKLWNNASLQEDVGPFNNPEILDVAVNVANCEIDDTPDM